jgi:hypothetical protein
VLTKWLLDKLQTLKDEQILLVRDPLRLLPEVDGALHRFAKEHGFTVVVASTNLAFRELFETASLSKDTQKLLVLDRTPARRRDPATVDKAPPPFYPDLLSRIPEEALIEVGLREFLVGQTGDPGWPQEANDPRIARLISGRLCDVLTAHENLRRADRTRLTDHDFKTIVAYAALGVPEAAFKIPEPGTYWRIALLGHDALEQLDSLAPQVALSIRQQLRTAPPPFCWFADHPPEQIVRAFYLATILSQHFEHWKLLLATVDPELKPFTDMDTPLIQDAARELVSLDRQRAHEDLLAAEDSLSKEDLHLLLTDQMKITENHRFVEAVEKEKYSLLIRSLALLLALDDLLSDKPAMAAHDQLSRLLSPEGATHTDIFIDQRPSAAWETLKQAYTLARSIRDIRETLIVAVRSLKVKGPADLSFDWFHSLWNGRRVNRLEYYLSALERLVHTADFLPRPASDLPPAFATASERILQRVGRLRQDTEALLHDLNQRFQGLVARHYKGWVQGGSDVLLTSQFLRLCLKPHWDPKTEKAVVFVFDGMRYDIWDELVRPIFEDRMEIIADYPATSLLPSETHISRKAISAGSFADSFDNRSSEDSLLAEALRREFGYKGPIDVVAPTGAGTGETVHYRARPIEFYIFELCDKELHRISVKTLPDGRRVPGRPLAFIYQQHIKDIIDTEVMAIVRSLSPDTKVFVVADHGFGAVGAERLRIDKSWLNEDRDCSYQNAWLRQTLDDVNAPHKVRANTLEFRPADLRLPASEQAYDQRSNRTWDKSFAAIIFPRTGYALARPKSPFRPDAYSHGGISIQEMSIPMVVMRVKAPEEGLITLGPISGPSDIVEGEQAEFRMSVQLAKSYKDKEIRLEAEARYATKEETTPIPRQVQYVSAPGRELAFRFMPDPADASDEELKAGAMPRTLRITIACREAERTVRKMATLDFTLRLNPDKIVRRVPPHLGRILGLTPKGMQ